MLASSSPGHASVWTEGQKRLVLIRVDFPDLPGAPFADPAGTNLVASLNDFFTEMSYRRAGFALAGAGSEVTPTFRLPQRADYYGTNNLYTQLRSDARAAAAAAGYILTNYDLDLICFGPVPGWRWSGLACVGSPGLWLRNSFNPGAAAHELGHNFGLNHANFWDTTGQSVIGPGKSVEQGDYFDTMGWALAGNNHFSARNKRYLNWLHSDEVSTVTTSGTYRIYAQDDPLATAQRALVIARSGDTNYWVEFRQKFTSNRWLMNGALLHLAPNGNQKSLLLDTTPGSADGENDSALVIGRTFSDPEAGIYITPVGKGGTTPESLDVVVNLGAFRANLPPTVTLTAGATEAAIGAPLAFSAHADDPNGDALAYYWDFGDGTFGTNGPMAGKSWKSAGQYNVRCLVTDMKGGLAASSVTVRIGTPATYCIRGFVTADGSPLANVRLYVSSTRMAWSDSDGSYTLTGLPAGTYSVNASFYDYSFSPSGFSGPVSVGPDASNIDFVATTLSTNPPSIIQQPQNQVVVAGKSASFSVAANGPSPLAYQWKFNGASLPMATNAVLTLANVAANQAGSYSVIVANSAGEVTSDPVLLSVYPSPAAVISILQRAGNQTTLSLTGVPGYQYVVEVSTNLLDWRSLQTNAAPFTLVDTDAGRFTRRFYRALYLP